MKGIWIQVIADDQVRRIGVDNLNIHIQVYMERSWIELSREGGGLRDGVVKNGRCKT